MSNGQFKGAPWARTLSNARHRQKVPAQISSTAVGIFWNLSATPRICGCMMNTKALEKSLNGSTAVGDLELVQRVRQGDEAACELIMRRYNQRMFRVARSIVTDDSEAEDVVQESYLRAFARIEQFHGPGLGPWLARIAANEALGRLRRGKRVVFLEDHLRQSHDSHAQDSSDTAAIMTSPTPGPERQAASGELGRLMEAAIDKLPDQYRAVFMLRAVEGMNVAETAASLAVRPETVKTRYHRARRLMQKALSRQLAEQVQGAFQFDGARCDRMVAKVMQCLRLPH